MAINGFGDIAHALGLNEYEAPEVRIYQEGSDESPVGRHVVPLEERSSDRKVVYRVDGVEIGGVKEYLAYLAWRESHKRPHATLAEQTMDDLRETFKRNGHQPSTAQWVGLKDLVSSLEAMADGKAEKLYYLSPLDPGVGKSQSIIHFSRRLLRSEAHKNVSVLICLGRLAEIKPMIEQMGLDDGDFAVLIQEADQDKTNERTVLLRELNKAGNADKRRARVLFTTQQMVDSRTRRHDSFEATEDFHYQGRPRQVRIWDEAILRAREMRISAALIGGMLPAATYSESLTKALNTVKAGIETKDHGAEFWVPDLPAETDLDTNDILARYGDEKDAIKEAASDLWELSNTPVIVEKIGATSAAIHYKKHLPDDLKPMVVCDASGRVRKTYQHWEKDVGKELVTLSHGGKNYRDLTVHIWRRGGGKASWDEDGAETLLEGIVRTIDEKPDARFLIVHHKASKRVADVEKAIRRRVKDSRRLKFTYWGGSDFKATNQYRDIENVILAGTLFYDQETYIARARMSSGVRSQEQLDKAKLASIKHGEHADLILQALCRGAVRKSIDGVCGKCDAYIIADPQTGIPAMLEHKGDIDIFPGSKAVDWSPVERQLTGKVGEAVSFIVQFFRDNPGHGDKLPAPLVANKLGMTRQDWSNDVLSHRDFEGALAAQGIRLVRMRGKGGSHFARM
ncbi:hypothetical protein [Mesorhizobium sp. B2-4-17]|uniref:hypothetical protein n=1 Tax=Mesorhizobium sp. B2-4-17 TaxID=2589932 RepID=UPI0011285617|nr:hypothetical protein [Mesorhizobium sp. B2-4-17]TPK91324.1 hypothetical protein FJ548_03475 [Mesorhizobium sp. B2-4-17]